MRVRSGRDPRLDFFRGVGMFIILIAHIPNNAWTLWIPARFGFSDATEMFVFLSGMASALAFGRAFDREGFARGSARVARRVWRIYWIHAAVFLVTAALLMAAGTAPDGESYLEKLNLMRFLADPGPLLARFLMLTYVPNYFDILPMYLVILAMLPVMMAAERLHKWAPLLLVVLLWMLAQAHFFDLPAEPWSDRTWFFNPFGWQLLFYLGFFLMRGTLRAPGFNRRLVIAASVFLMATLPFAWHGITEASPFFAKWAEALSPLTNKTRFGILRLLHFAALAYLAVLAVGEGGRRLKGAAVGIVSKVGQQTLPVFVTGMTTAQLVGVALDYGGRDAFATVAVNVVGFGVLIAIAYGAAWFKSATPRASGAAAAARS